MTLQDILAELRVNNAKTEGFYTTDQLVELFKSASIDVPALKRTPLP